MKTMMKTKEKLIEATMDLAMSSGLGAVSLGDVAEHVGIKKPSIYNHFPSKAALIEAVYHTLKEQSPNKEFWCSDALRVNLAPLEDDQAIAYFVNHYHDMQKTEGLFRRHRLVQTEKFFSEDMKCLAESDSLVLIEALTDLLKRLAAKRQLKTSSLETVAAGMAYAVQSIHEPEASAAFCKKYWEVFLTEDKMTREHPLRERLVEEEPVKSGGLLWRNRNSDHL